MLKIKEYVKAESMEHAWELNQKRSAKILGGMLWLKMSSQNIQTAVDLSGLGLDQIEETEDAFTIGCMATLRQMELHPGLAAYTAGAMAESVRHIVGVQFRNLATVGGSIYGRYGFSDVLTLLLGLESYVELYKGGIIPLKEYANMKYDRDILVRIIVKKRPVNMYYEAVRITETDLPVLTCCGVHYKDTDTYEVAIGARPARAVLVSSCLNDSDCTLSGELSNDHINKYADMAADHIETESNMRGSKEYRSHLVNVLTKRTLSNI